MPLRAGTATPTFRLGTVSVSRMYLGSALAYSQSGAGGGGTGGGSSGGGTVSAPYSLTAVAGDAAVVLAWKSAVGPTAFSVQASSDGGSLWQDVPSGYAYSQTTAAGVISSTATIGSLTNGSSYVFRVAARTASAVSGWSAVSNKAVLNTVPTTPAGVTAAVSGRSVVVSWTASTGSAAILYTLYRSSGVSDYIPIASGISDLTYALTPGADGVTPGSDYTFKVQATYDLRNRPAGDSVYSPPSAISSASGSVTAPVQLATAPIWLDAEASAASIFVRFLPPAWNGGAAITAYNVYVYPVLGTKPATPTVTVAASAPTLYNDWRRVHVTGLTNLTTYRASVFAVTSAGEGEEKWGVATPKAQIIPIQSLSVSALASGSRFEYAAGQEYNYPSAYRAVAITWSTAPYSGSQPSIAIEYVRADFPVSARYSTLEGRLYEGFETLTYPNEPLRQFNSGGNTIDRLAPNTTYIIRVRDVGNFSPYAYWVITTAA